MIGIVASSNSRSAGAEIDNDRLLFRIIFLAKSGGNRG
jgi:hypothetical protein